MTNINDIKIRQILDDQKEIRIVCDNEDQALELAKHILKNFTIQNKRAWEDSSTVCNIIALIKKTNSISLYHSRFKNENDVPIADLIKKVIW